MPFKERKCIAIFTAYMPPHVGGIERYVSNLTNWFVKLGYHIIIVTSNYNNLEYFEEGNNVTTIRIPIYNIFKNRYPIPKRNRIMKDLIKKLDNYNVSRIIVNTRFHLTSFIGVRYGIKKKIPVYLVEHGSNYVTLDNKFIDFFANRYEDILTFYLKNKVNGFYGVSNACGLWLKQFGINYDGVWYNSVECNKKEVIKKKHSGINFLYAGRIIKQKGVYNILLAFNELVKKYDNINLYIAGDGSELEKYKNDFCYNKIHFLERLEYEDLEKYYMLCDIFLYPPLWPEGLPTSILEAGMMKCAVIATDQGGIKEIINDNKNGLIVSKNINDLKDAMEKLILNDEMRYRLADNLYNTVKKKFSWEVTAKKILKDIDL